MFIIFKCECYGAFIALKITSFTSQSSSSSSSSSSSQSPPPPPLFLLNTFITKLLLSLLKSYTDAENIDFKAEILCFVCIWYPRFQ